MRPGAIVVTAAPLDGSRDREWSPTLRRYCVFLHYSDTFSHSLFRLTGASRAACGAMGCNARSLLGSLQHSVLRLLSEKD
jgi:hypothetical protein